MGNHEYCTGCGASDFHDGMSCQQAYPEGYARKQKEKKEKLEEERKGEILLHFFVKKLKKLGLDKAWLSIEMNSVGNLEVHIHGFDLARANQKKLLKFLDLKELPKKLPKPKPRPDAEDYGW